ncbi:RING-H2 finger protein ATL29 [Spatholobus suberectus]|nr:RING-H2 finger protein ATL29 [Spatholobus suberectus]
MGLSTHRLGFPHSSHTKQVPPRGLDPSLLQVFPTFLYSSVKDLRKEKYSLECAICLLEFEEDNMLRLLTLCCHVFHQDCIDLWLRSHKTCPVCRRDLDSPTEETQKCGDVMGEEGVGVGMVSSTSGEIRIDVREVEEGGARDGNQRQEREGTDGEHDHAVIHQQVEQTFVRSHSTGHSIVLIRGEGDEGKDDDKYTLRLPEHVLRVRQNKHNCTRSCASYRDMTRLVAAAPCSNCGFIQPLSAGCSFPGHTQKS